MKKAFIKKIMCMTLIFSLCSCLFTGCGKTKDESNKDTYRIGICQLVQHESLDDSTKGFMDALEDKLGDKVIFDYQNASGEASTCTAIVNQFVSDKVDLIMANATSVLHSAMSSTADIPIVATSITDYATALDIDDWTGVSGINVTGTSDLAPLNEQAAMIKELCPDAKTVGVLYCSSEPNSKYQYDIIKVELETLGYEVKEYTVAESNSIAAVTATACEEVDCIFVPTDNTLASAGAIIHEIAYPQKVPVFASVDGICKECGIATIAINYYNLGYESGLMAYEILVNGADPAEMEIKYSTDLTKKYIAERMEYFNIEVPDDYVELTIE